MELSGQKRPHLVIPIGIPGAGKTYFSERFGSTFNSPIINFDQISQDIFGGSVSDKEDSKKVQTLVFHILNEVLKTKQTIIYDGPTNMRSERSEIAKIARESGYTPLFVWIQTDQNTAKKRALAKKNYDNNQFNIELKKFSTPHSLEKSVVISGKYTYSSQLKIILSHLAKSNGESNKSELRPNRRILIR